MAGKIPLKVGASMQLQGNTIVRLNQRSYSIRLPVQMGASGNCCYRDANGTLVPIPMSVVVSGYEEAVAYVTRWMDIVNSEQERIRETVLRLRQMTEQQLIQLVAEVGKSCWTAARDILPNPIQDSARTRRRIDDDFRPTREEA